MDHQAADHQRAERLEEPGTRHSIAGPNHHGLGVLSAMLNTAPAVQRLAALNLHRPAIALSSPPVQLKTFAREFTADYGDLNTDDAEDVLGFLQSCQGNDVDAAEVDDAVWTEIRSVWSKKDTEDGRNIVALLDKVEPDGAAIESAEQDIAEEKHQPAAKNFDDRPAIEKISNTKLEGSTPSKGNSRVKQFFLFDDAGNIAVDPSTATYAVDKNMPETEYLNYEKVRQWGVKVPELFGRTKDGYAIVQWVPNHTTAGGGGGHAPVGAVKKRLAQDTGQAFAVQKWTNALKDIDQLIALNYTSPDLQFMIDQFGHVFIMDLEENNLPQRRKVPDKKLTDVHDAITQWLEHQHQQDQSSSAPKPTQEGSSSVASEPTGVDPSSQ